MKDKKSAAKKRKSSVEKNKIIFILLRYFIILSLMFSLPVKVQIQRMKPYSRDTHEALTVNFNIINDITSKGIFNRNA